MKSISAKLILLSVLLVTAMIAFTSLWSIRILERESIAYTLQEQQLQVQLLSKSFELSLANARNAAAPIFSYVNSVSKNGNLPEGDSSFENAFKLASITLPSIRGAGVHLKGGNRWTEFPPQTISGVSNEVPASSQESMVPDSSPESGDGIFYFPFSVGVLALRINLSHLQEQSDGLPVGLFNWNYQPLVLGRKSVEGWVSKAPGAFTKIMKSRFNSGAQELSEKGESGLWAYSNLSPWGKVISINEIAVARRPSSILGIQIVLLALAAVGVSVLLSVLVARTVVRPIKIVSEGTKRIAEGDFDSALEVKTQDETRVLADSVNSMAKKIKALILAEIEATKLNQQLEIAGTVQKTLIPGTTVVFAGFRVQSLYRSADQCGGDWWGYIEGKQKVAILVGDVTGHGYPSALIVATTRGYLTMLQEQVNRVGEIDFTGKVALEVLNRVVYDATKGELNMTAVCVVIDRETGHFTIANAGHVGVFHLKPSAEKCILISTPGPRLGEGVELSRPILEKEGCLEGADEKLVMYTDGVPELGTEAKPLGRKEFRKFLERNVKASAESIVRAVEEQLIPLNHGQPLVDDVTFVVVEMENQKEVLKGAVNEA